MASWSENSSYQGAASGAAAGSTVAPGWGTAIGAAVGFVAGGMMGGAQEDAAKAAESDRLKKIQEAIDRQNTKDFKAKSQAEQWALADIGINKEDQVMDARANNKGLIKNVKATGGEVAKTTNHQKENANGHYKNLTDMFNSFRNQNDTRNPTNKVTTATLNSKVAKDALTVNQGIIANYDDEMGAPKKY